MSKITKLDTAPADGASVEDRLARLLDSPFLARVVPHLPADTLHQIVLHRGLDACGELVTLATPAQLTSLLDLDLWHRARPGRDHSFDSDRFGEWLEVLIDTGDSVAARTVAALDTNIVVTGLSRYVRVFDPGIFEPTAQSDDEAIDRYDAMREGDSAYADAAGDRPESEVGGYLVRARRTDAWDAIVALLIALDTEQSDCFHAVMQGCRLLSNSRPELSGFDDLLQAHEQHVHDVTLEREHRQSQQGYATPADARAFLEMARQPKGHAGNPIVAAYFRAADDGAESLAPTAPPSSGSSQPSTLAPSPEGHAAPPESIDAIFELLAEAGIMPQRPRALLEAAPSDEEAVRLPHLRRLMRHVHDANEDAYLARSRELAFLANTLLAGCSVQSRPFTPREASDAAASVCNLGLECLPDRRPEGLSRQLPDAWLNEHDLVTAFEVGWSILHHDVTLFAVDQLTATLTALDCGDRVTRLELLALKRALLKQREAGTPWRARHAVEVLAMLDTTAWVGVLGLLDECPNMPAALTAVAEGRTTTVSATEFEFISTAEHVSRVRTFLAKLPDLLSR